MLNHIKSFSRGGTCKYWADNCAVCRCLCRHDWRDACLRRSQTSDSSTSLGICRLQEGAAVRMWDVSRGLRLRWPGTGVTGGIGLLASCFGNIASAAQQQRTRREDINRAQCYGINTSTKHPARDTRGFMRVQSNQSLLTHSSSRVLVCMLGILDAKPLTPTCVQPEVEGIKRIEGFHALYWLCLLPGSCAIAATVLICCMPVARAAACLWSGHRHAGHVLWAGTIAAACTVHAACPICGGGLRRVCPSAALIGSFGLEGAFSE